MTADQGVAFGDHVRIATSKESNAAGYAGRDGTCMGFTTPSVTGVDVVGAPNEDLAYAVEFEGGETVWFSPDLVEFLDHAAGTDVRIGDKDFVRDAGGEWKEVPPSD